MNGTTKPWLQCGGESVGDAWRREAGRGLTTVACYFWQDQTRANRGYTFCEDHVRILRNMVSRNLTLAHRFVCVTAEKIEGIETVPMDWRKHVPGTVYARLMQHNPEWARANLGERILSLDLDIVVTRNIDHLVSRNEDFVIWKNPNFGTPRRAFYQSSVQLFHAGARPQLWTDFDPNETPKWVNWRFGGAEQAWISERLEWDEACFSDRDGIYGAGRLGGNGVYSELPENACIVSFPGAREPSQKEVQEKHPWVKEHYR